MSEVWNVLVREGQSKRADFPSFTVQSAGILSLFGLSFTEKRAHSLWSAIVSNEACAPLVDLLIGRAPQLVSC